VLYYVEISTRALPDTSGKDIDRSLRRIGYIRYQGVGTAVRLASRWYEVNSDLPDIPAVRAALSPWKVIKVVEIARGEGKILARQLELFGAR